MTRRQLRLVAAFLTAGTAVACGSPEDRPAPPPSAAAPSLPDVVPPAAVPDLVSRPDGPVLLDVRTPEEYAEGHVPGATSIPIDDLVQRLPELHAWRERGVITYCRSGRRAGRARDLLEEHGFRNVALMDGSMNRWNEEGRPVETGPP